MPCPLARFCSEQGETMDIAKRTRLLACLAVALWGMSVSSSSATTLEVEGVARNEFVTVSASQLFGTSTIFRDTAGFSSNTCTQASLGGTAFPPSGSRVWMPLSSLTFASCAKSVVVHAAGELEIEYISGTTNGTVKSSGLSLTMGSPFGTLTCSTGFTHLGTLTGSKWFPARLDVNATFNCSGISHKWEASYEITSPWGLGVVA